MKTIWPLLLLLHQMSVVFPSSLPAGSGIPALIVFGDSSVDPGNNNYIPTIARSNFLPYGRDFFGREPTGRFCNGRLATDFISEALGLKTTVPAYLDPAYTIEDFATGVSFASAATGLDNTTADVLCVMPLWKELELFREYKQRLRESLGDEANKTIGAALYVISIGTNDFMENYFVNPIQSTRYTVDDYQDFLIKIARDFVIDLYNLGARNIDFSGLCPIGCMPLARAVTAFTGHSGCNEDYNNAAKEFNRKLKLLVEQLNQQLRDIKLVYTDVYDHFLSVFQEPNLFGFEDWTRGCCGTGLFEMSYACDRWNPYTCQDASKYVFWDAFHPSEAMNRLVAHSALNNSLKTFALPN